MVGLLFVLANPGPYTTPITVLTTPTTPACNQSDCLEKYKPESLSDGAIIGIVIGVIIVIANVVATGLFFWYYKKVQVSHSGKKERNNKLKLDRRFPWLKKMMPCVSDTTESTGRNCLWVSLFILLGIVTGIITFPIWILLANKHEKNNETSALNKRENGEGSASGENGRRPANNSSANHSQPPPTNQMNAIRREDPYQNESSRENIELNNSIRSRNHLLPGSPQSRPPPGGRPPPPPNKPITMNLSRSKDYSANDQTQHANPEHTTYADLPFVPRNTLPTATPVQFLNVSNDTYAELNKT
jgi:flagellar basal body-associated protein FliL